MTDLEPLMRPRSIAVVGASRREVRANRVIRTLQKVGFDGPIYPINPNYPDVLGLDCYPDLAATPEPADCAVVAIQAGRVPDVLAAGAEAGVSAAIVLASGFGETGDDGRQLERRIVELSGKGMAICGPNCFGILNVAARTAPFIGVIPEPLLAGNVALISQSGGLTNLVVPPLGATRAVGFSYVVSCGNQAGATIEDFADFCVEDASTEVIAIFVEGFKQPARLVEVAGRARAAGKPIVVLKVGRSEIAQRTALAHTGSIVGRADVVEAVLRQHGIIQTRSLNEFVETIALLAMTRGSRHRWGPRLGIVTGNGGLMGYFGDVAEEIGLAIPNLSERTAARLAEIMPEFAGATNPVDGTGAMYEDPELFPGLLTRLAEDDAIDVVAVNLDFNPRGPDTLDAARRQFVPDIIRVAPGLPKPVVAFTARAGNVLEPEVSADLRAAAVPLLDGTEPAFRALRSLADLAARDPGGSRAAPRALPGVKVDGLDAGVQDSVTAFRLVAEAGIKVVPTELARTVDDAAEAARRVGLPVALKVESPQVQHKAASGGVALGLDTLEAVRKAYAQVVTDVKGRSPGAEIRGVLVQSMAEPGVELLVGVTRDPSFGPVVACGLGGVLVEVLDDVAVGVPPLLTTDAREMLERLRGWPLLSGERGPRADVEAIVEAICALGDLALALGDRLEAIDVNPLIAYPAGGGVLAVDALVELR